MEIRGVSERFNLAVDLAESKLDAAQRESAVAFALSGKAGISDGEKQTILALHDQIQKVLTELRVFLSQIRNNKNGGIKQ